MAIVQISKIQIRRDVKDASADSDLPIRLSDGEFAWCRDTRQLYIGSAIVGSPGQTENVELLTQYSDIFNLGRYNFKGNGVFRSFSKRFEDRVSINDFGIFEGNIEENANKNNLVINRAINLLFNLTPTKSKLVLEFPPGIFLFNETIAIPSDTKIVGAGKGNTIIRFLAPGSVFESRHLDPTAIEPNTQNKNMKFKDLTIQIQRPSVITQDWLSRKSVIFDLHGSVSCEFINLELIGPTSTSVVESGDIQSRAFLFDDSRFYTNEVEALVPQSLSLSTYSNKNLIDNVNFKNLDICINSKFAINKNLISNCFFTDSRTGIDLGDPSFQGPYQNIIRSSFFDRIARYAIKLRNGTYNICAHNTYLNVGNNFGNNQNNKFPQVEFNQPGNLNINYITSRHNDLSGYGPNSLSNRGYISEFSGFGHNTTDITYTKNITFNTSPVDLIRLPTAMVDPNLGPYAMGIEVDYLYQSKTVNSLTNDPAIFKKARRLRKGKLSIIVDYREDFPDIPTVDLIDEYDYLGFGLPREIRGAGPTSLPNGISLINNEDIRLVFTVKVQYNNISKQNDIVIQYSHDTETPQNQRIFEEGKLTYIFRILT